MKRAPYEDAEALKAAFVGADTVLFVSASVIGKRVELHRNVVRALTEAGINRVVYTSGLKADTTGMKLAAEHLVTERMLAETGLPVTILRNGWYTENYNVAQALEHGLFGAVGGGKIAGAPRTGYAEAEVSAVLGDGLAGKV